MNFLRGALASDGEPAWVSNGQRLALPAAWTSALTATYESVVFGVRPEDVEILSQPDSASLPAEVYVAEALGNETLVRLQVGNQELVARASADYEPDIGSRVWIKPNLERAHLFDARDERRII